MKRRRDGRQYPLKVRIHKKLNNKWTTVSDHSFPRGNWNPDPWAPPGTQIHPNFEMQVVSVNFVAEAVRCEILSYERHPSMRWGLTLTNEVCDSSGHCMVQESIVSAKDLQSVCTIRMAS